MPASGPLVSVIIPVYNAEKFIGETLDSVFAQTWTNKEVIVVNDGSTDNTSALLEQLHHPQLTIINQQNGGASKAKQIGLERAAGDFIQYLDADDLLAPRKIELQIGPLLENPQKIAICKTAHFFDGSDYKFDNLPDDDHFFKNYLDEPLLFLLKLYGGLDLHAGMIHPNSFLIPKTIARKAGGWDASFSPCPDEDGEYFCRIILNAKGIIYFPEALNYYRKFKLPTSLSGNKSPTALRNLSKSSLLKHKHLLSNNNDPELIPFIHTATYRQLDEIRVMAYPHDMKLYTEITKMLESLTPHAKGQYRIFGGKFSNLIGNNVSWKLLRHLQHYRGRIKN